MFSFASRIILTYGVERCATLGAYLCIIRILSATLATVNHNNSLNIVCYVSVLRFAVARRLLMRLPGFEPGAIEPKALLKISWSGYKQCLFSKYDRSYAVQLFEYSRKYSRKYYPLFDDVNSILLSKPELETT